MRRRSQAKPKVNRCPDCGEPQFHAPGSGWTCENGHGYGEPNGPEENAAPTPPSLLRSAPKSNDNDFDVDALLDEGDTITVTWGGESFSPIRFFNAEVGPFTATVRIRPGEKPSEARARATAFVEATAALAWQSKIEGHLGRVRDSHKLVEAVKEAAKGKG